MFRPVASSLLRASSKTMASSGAAVMRTTCFGLVAASSSPAAAMRFQPSAIQTRGLKTLDFGGVKEEVVERSDYPKEKYQAIFAKDTLAMLGYGTQGRGQALNLRDNGLNVILGIRKDSKANSSWEKAKQDGWVEGKNLFPIEEALKRGTVIMNLLSDAGQAMTWNQVKPHLTKGKTLYLAHGFAIAFADQTKVVPPKDIDVILCAPKGSGTTVRSLFLSGRGINGSVAVYQDVSGKARERAFALGIAVGCGYLYETTLKKEAVSDLTGERGVLMGMIEGAFRAQYKVLRAHGHSPSEAFNETVEEATQSLYPLIGANGMDWMFANCSTTAQRGALDWAPRFEKALAPVFEKLYNEVENGNEARRTLDLNSRSDYKEMLKKELDEIKNSEMWRAGQVVRQLRPENNKW